VLDEEKLTQLIKDAFIQYDHDRSGFLGRSELREYFVKIFGEACESYFDAIIDGIDTNHSGKVSRQEMRQTLKAWKGYGIV
jgi:Ca2+-binding EF-hand superfamily protein